MDKRFKNIIFISFIFLIFGVGTSLLFHFIRSNNNVEMEEEKINVIVSILPQKEFVESVGGELVEVTELIHPGESPATYSLTSEDLVIIENADVYFRIGHIPFESSNIEKIKEINPDLKIVDLSENVNLRYFSDGEEHEHEEIDYESECKFVGGEWLESFEECESQNLGVVESEWCESLGGDFEECASACRHSENSDVCIQVCVSVCTFDEEHSHSEVDSESADAEIDPHLWLSLDNAKIMVNQIYKTFAEIDSEYTSFYESNKEDYLNSIYFTQVYLEEALESVNGSKLLVFHPAWGYLADEFGLEQVAIEQDGKEPTAEQLQEIIDLINSENIKVLFVQSQFSTESAESIANDTGIAVVTIDPLAENYIENIGNIGNVIKENLE